MFSYPYISYIANKKLEGEEEFHSKYYLWEMAFSHAAVCQKLCNGKSFIKGLFTRL